MGPVGAALELGVELHPDVEVPPGQFHGLHQASVGARTRDDQPHLLQFGPVIVVELVPMAVAFLDHRLVVAVVQPRALGHGAGVFAQAHGAALGQVALLVGHQVDDVVGAVGLELAGIGVRVPGHMAGELHDHDLHAQADAEVGDLLFPGIAGGLDHALHAPVAEPAGQDDAVHAGQLLGAAVLVGQGLAVHPADVHLALVLEPGVVQTLHHAQVGVVQLDVLAHQGDGAGLAAGGDAGDQVLPLGQIAFGGVQVQLAGHGLGQAGGLQHQRALVQAGHGQVFNDAVGPHVAEQADLALDVAAHGAVRPQHDHVGGNAHALQFLAGMLGRLGLVLVRARDIGHQHHMDEAAVFRPLFQAHLADGLQKRLALDVAGGAADLGDDHVGLGAPGQVVDITLDLVGDVGDDLHGLAQVSPLAFLAQHVPVHLAGGQVGILVQILVDEAFIMPQVQVGLGAVVGDEHLPVLQGAHGAGVHVDIGVQLLGRHLQPPGLEQPAQAGGRNALAQPRDHAPCHKDKFCTHRSRSPLYDRIIGAARLNPPRPSRPG